MTLSSAAKCGWPVFIAVMLAYLTMPLVLVILFSFNRSALTSFPMTGLTLDWYRKLALE